MIKSPCDCQKPVSIQTVETITEKCGSCGGLNANWNLENFYRSVVRTSINDSDLPPFQINVAELPYAPKGLMTIDKNTEFEEVVQYEYDQGIIKTFVNGIQKITYTNAPTVPGTITIVKRGIHPAAQDLIVNGQGNSIVVFDGKEQAAEYNHCQFMKTHRAGATISRDITAQEVNMFNRYTCCRVATVKTPGIVSLMCEPLNPENPIVVGSNCIANFGKKGIVFGLSKLTANGEEVAVSWNDGATSSKPGLVKVSNPKNCNNTNTPSTGTITNLFAPSTLDLAVLRSDHYALVDQAGIGFAAKNKCPSGIATFVTDDYFATSSISGIARLKPANITCVPSSSGNANGDPLIVSQVIQAGDSASPTNLALVKITAPTASCIITETCPLAVSKFDKASQSNDGVTSLSTIPCVPCTPIAVGDNDPRLFRQRTQMRNFENELSTPFATVSGNYLVPFSGYLGTSSRIRNVELTSVPLVCGTKNSTYYGISGSTTDIGPASSVMPIRTGVYMAGFSLRILINNANFTRNHHQVRSRIMVNGVATDIGDLALIINRNTLFGTSTTQEEVILHSTGDLQLTAGDLVTLSVDFDPLQFEPTSFFMHKARLYINE